MLTQQYTLEQSTAPTVEPVTTAEAKTFGWVSINDDDTHIGQLITQVRELMEELTGIVLITSTYKQYFDYFPCEIKLLRMPSPSITAFTYTDTAGTSQTLTSSDYQLDAKSRPPRLRAAYGTSWPSTRPQTMNAVTVTYTAGYGAAGSSVPERFKKRLAQGVKFIYDNRDQVDWEWLEHFLSKGWHGDLG